VSQNSRAHLYKLTDRETDVLELMAKAMTNREIGDALGVGVEAVRMHAKNIYAKLEVSGRQKASLKAIELGLIQTDSGTQQSTHNNLPFIPTEFVGRTDELNELHKILSGESRLVTILGAGGMGKTRLALAYAHQHLDHYTDGVFFIPLESVQTTDGIILQIIEELDLRASARSSQKQQLLNYLSDKHMLLLIDNWEHLLDSAMLVSEILSVTTHIKIIATSRERLSLMGETVFRLNGLTIPTDQDLETIRQSDAIRLVHQTARRSIPTWDIDEHNVRAVQQLCHLTEGMPLGIILAISWIDVYPLEEIIKEIQKNVDFLQTDMRNVPQRHRSIRSVFEWTWQLLSDDERSVFMKLSIFRNGCTLEAIEAVTDANPRVLQSLVSKALIYRYTDNRYYLHELLRQYGTGKLGHDNTVEHETRDRHAEYYANVAEHIMSNRIIGDDAKIELENLYSAWQWAVDSDNIPLLWQCVNAYGIIAYQLGCLVEMKQLYEYALARRSKFEAGHQELVGCWLFVSASIYAYLRDYEARDAHIKEAHDIFDESQLATYRPEVIYAHYHGVLATRGISFDLSMAHLTHVIHALDTLNFENDIVFQTMLVYAHSQQAYLITLSPAYESDTVTAKQPALKALHMAKKIQHKTMIGFITTILGERAFLVRNYAQAEDYLAQADEAFQGLNSPYDHGSALIKAGANAFVQEHYDTARVYLHRGLDMIVDFGLSVSMFLLIAIVARWKYQVGDVIGATELIAYVRHNKQTAQSDILISYFWRNYTAPEEPDDLKFATERGQTMSYDTVLRDVVAWLEE